MTGCRVESVLLEWMLFFHQNRELTLRASGQASRLYFEEETEKGKLQSRTFQSSSRDKGKTPRRRGGRFHEGRRRLTAETATQAKNRKLPADGQSLHKRPCGIFGRGGESGGPVKGGKQSALTRTNNS